MATITIQSIISSFRSALLSQDRQSMERSLSSFRDVDLSSRSFYTSKCSMSECECREQVSVFSFCMHRCTSVDIVIWLFEQRVLTEDDMLELLYYWLSCAGALVGMTEYLYYDLCKDLLRFLRTQRFYSERKDQWRTSEGQSFRDAIQYCYAGPAGQETLLSLL